ncbi:hypothetical protein FJY94_02075 [Candidatus Kaiserbacteria bacterium]|nr:hypothetical protein [Candidatus Kaiserbacteria bacterium]
MSDEWMKLGALRQEFLEELKRYIIDEEEETHRRMELQAPLAMVLLAHLAQAEGVQMPLPKGLRAETFFKDKILPEIRAFAKSDEEVTALVAEILEWETASIVQRCRVPLMVHDEMSGKPSHLDSELSDQDAGC